MPLTTREVVQRAVELGFDMAGVAQVAGTAPHYPAFAEWLGKGMHGGMHYLAREPERRRDPGLLLPGCLSVVLVGASYDGVELPEGLLQDPGRGRIARYAWGADYHDMLTPRLRALGDFVAASSRAYVDTGAVLERAWAEQAGLGFVGRNTCLIHPRQGSYLFLGAVLVGDALDPTPVYSGRACGACRRCLDACPTGAFPREYELDARRCISYLTIELKGAIPPDLRPLTGNWIFGCDVCQEVCPYVRRYARPARDPAFQLADPDRAAPRLADILGLGPADFRARYRSTPLMRAKWRGVLRNACVAAGNWARVEPHRARGLAPLLADLAAGDEPMVREHAQWALAQW